MTQYYMNIHEVCVTSNSTELINSPVCNFF